MAEHGHSAFDLPGDWGAKRGIRETEEEALERLTLELPVTKKPLRLHEVREILQGTSYTF